MTDRDWLMLTLWGEARGETTVGRLAVADVIRNRLRLGRWGHSYESVVCAPRQFSCWNATDPNLPKLKALIDTIEHDGTFPIDPILKECGWIADGFLAEAVRPQVRGATHYYAIAIAHPPRWAQTGELVATIGGHAFFAKVA